MKPTQITNMIEQKGFNNLLNQKRVREEKLNLLDVDESSINQDA